VLEEKAEQIRFLLPRKKCYGGGWEPFTCHRRGLFRPQGVGTSKRGKLFSSSQRQFLIEHIITSRITDGGADLMMRGMTLSSSPLLRVIDQRFPLHMEQRLEALRKKWLFRCRPWGKSGFCCKLCGCLFCRCCRCCGPCSCCKSDGGRNSDGDDNDDDTSPSSAVMAFSPGGKLARKKKGKKKHAWYDSPERRSSVDLDLVGKAQSPPGLMQHVSVSEGREDLAYYDSTDSEEDDEINGTEGGGTPRSRSRANSASSQRSMGMPASGRNGRFHPTSRRYHRKRGCCSRIWNWFIQKLFGQPLDDIALYFGEGVAFYFAYVEFYTRALALPALLGAILFGYQAHRFFSASTDESGDVDADGHLTTAVESHATIDTDLHIVWAAFLACWATGKLVYWRQRENDLAYRWGTMKCEEVETCRPQYYGYLQIDPDTKEYVKVYPAWKRAFKFIVTYTMVATLLFLFGRATWSYHQWREFKLQEWVNGANADLLEEYEAGLGLTDPLSSPPPPVSLYVFSSAEFKDHMQYWQWWTFMFVLPFGYGVAVPAINIVTMKVSLLFNQWENHETESTYQKHMIVKVFLFRFVVVFSSLIYYAFSPLLSSPQLSEFLDNGSNGSSGSRSEASFTNQGEASYQLGLQVFLLMLGGLAYSMLSAFVLPYLIIAWKGRLFRKQVNHLPVRLVDMWPYLHPGEIRKQLLDAHSQVWVECQLPEYEPFKDYTEILVQFGYVTFFSVAFPLAPLLAFLFNLVEIRADAHKLCYVKQRPLARKASGIGVWYSCIWFIAVLSVLTNCALIYLTRSESEVGDNAFNSGVTGKKSQLFLFVYEHMLILMLFLGGNSFPERSQWLRRAEKRDRHRAERWQKSQAVMSMEKGEEWKCA
jgi:anoctamin-8